MKSLLRLLTLLLVVGLAAGPAMGASFSLVLLNIEPAGQNVFVDDVLTAELKVSGLENDDLGGFDVDLGYDANYLAFSDYLLGDHLGLVDDIEATDWSDGDDGFGTINLAEISYLLDFSSQPDTFTLATIEFTAIASTGDDYTQLTIPYFDLTDANGEALDFVVELPGFIKINPVPVPGAVWLLATGLLGVIGLRRHTRG
jgi:hypothetical protein